MTVEIYISFQLRPEPTYHTPIYPGGMPGPFRPRPVPMPAVRPAPPGFPSPVRARPQVAAPTSQADRVKQFIALAQSLHSVVLADANADTFLAISPAAVVHAEGMLPPKLRKKIYKAFDEIIETNLGVNAPGGIEASWVRSAYVQNIPQAVAARFQSELQRGLAYFACPKCGNRIAEHPETHWCPFCGHKLVTGKISVNLRVCKDCLADKDSHTTWVYHQNMRFCPRCGARLKIWQNFPAWRSDADDDMLREGIPLTAFDNFDTNEAVFVDDKPVDDKS